MADCTFKHAVFGLAALLLASAIVRAQAPARFEVASIKPNTSVSTSGGLGPQPGGRVSATNMPLRQLIGFAYQTGGALRLAGGPDWIGTERFDIIAKLEGDATLPPAPAVMAEALRTLLEDRFHVKTHHEDRELDVYALQQLRADGRINPALKKSSQDCSPEGMKAHALPADTGIYCGMRISSGTVVAGGTPMSQLLGLLSGLTSRVVVDRTGLDGGWDFEFTFTPARPGAEPPTDPNAPSIFTALQE
ncbi:MAG TPA: TIGR03435 family protein, partial [Vicinamibacterales bacterium]|nr:TIGR03435 family protein [Vicinamibacterales bacterium]